MKSIVPAADQPFLAEFVRIDEALIFVQLTVVTSLLPNFDADDMRSANPIPERNAHIVDERSGST